MAQYEQPSNKPGRTLLVKMLVQSSDTKYSTVTSAFTSLTGLVSQFQTNTTNSFFLTFDTLENSTNALNLLKETHSANMRVKFAYYHLFFTLQNTDSMTESDASKLQTQHYDLVKETGGEVLLYRMYRKNNKYIGCGDFQVDTKSSFDKLLDIAEKKNFSLNNTTGIHYIYKKTRTRTPKNIN